MPSTLNLQIDSRPEGPIYQRIADAVCEAAASGRIVPGEKLPAMSALAKQLRVSPLTVGRSYELLESRGIVTQKQGSGTYLQSAAVNRVRQATRRRVATIHVVLGETCLAKCPRETLFITTDIMGGIRDVLGQRETQIVYAKAFQREYLDDLQAEDVVLIRSYINSDPSLAAELLNRGIRVVSMWEAHLGFSNVPFVRPDNHHATVLATQHLIDCGYRRIGYIGRKTHQTLPASPKFVAFVTALSNAGLDLCARYVRDVKTAPVEAYAAARDILQTGDLPDAFFVDTDYKAMEVIAAINHAGLRVPEDIGIASFDDVPEAATFTPPLTTVYTPRREIGHQIAEMFLDWQVDGTMPQSVVLPSTLRVRGSTRSCVPSPTSTIS